MSRIYSTEEEEQNARLDALIRLISSLMFWGGIAWLAIGWSWNLALAISLIVGGMMVHHRVDHK